MKKCRKKFKANTSGQLLIVASLAIAVLISSTMIYVYELCRETNSADASSLISDFVIALKLSMKNTMISSLANAGIWLSWEMSDVGVSSAYANFTLTVYGRTAQVTMPYAVNVTTAIAVTGSYVRLVGEEKLVSLTCKVYNDGEPALAKNLNFFYENLGDWTKVDASNNLSVVDYGNGTYCVSFTINAVSDIVNVSTHVYDSRDIFVRANTTCYET